MNLAEIYFTVLFLLWAVPCVIREIVTRRNSRELTLKEFQNRILTKAFLTFASGISGITLLIFLLPVPSRPPTVVSSMIFIIVVFFLFFLAGRNFHKDFIDYKEKKRAEELRFR